MNNSTRYDVAVIGGGPGGMAAAIMLARAGFAVVLFEKGSYPTHKVCGEYVSFESWCFLQQLGLPLSEMELPQIDHLYLTATNGRMFETRLPLGGFGISRYRLDESLGHCARAAGVTLLENTRVEDVRFDGRFTIKARSKGIGEQYFTAEVCCGAWGKRSNMDLRWERSFLLRQDRRLDNFVGVKYHLRANWPAHTIGLHNFPGGYCGISKVEEDRTCLCYLVRASRLRDSGGSIAQMEQQVLSQNPHLKQIFSNSEVLPPFPVTISQITFQTKAPVEQHVLLLGDAAGMISPLCGNGMSIALHCGKLAAGYVSSYLQGQLSRDEMERAYALAWKSEFSGRLGRGRMLQRFFGGNFTSNLFVQLFRSFPRLATPVIRSTHGSII